MNRWTLAAYFFLLALICLVLTGVWWLRYHTAPERRTEAMAGLESQIRQELPLGSSKAHVIDWLAKNNFTFYSHCFDDSHKDKRGRYLDPAHEGHDISAQKNPVYSDFACTDWLQVNFAFGKGDNLIRLGIDGYRMCFQDKKASRVSHWRSQR